MLYSFLFKHNCTGTSPEVCLPTTFLLFLPLPWCSPLCVSVDWQIGAPAAASCRRWCGGSSSRPAGHQMWKKCAPLSPYRRQGRPHPPTSAFSASYPSCQCLRSQVEGASERGRRWKTRPWWEVGGEEINSGTKKQTAYLEEVLIKIFCIKQGNCGSQKQIRTTLSRTKDTRLQAIFTLNCTI